MAPKKKGGKKQADDWENELGETVDPIAQATADAKKEEDENAAADGDMNGSAPGGLLAALRKNKDKRAKKGKPVNDFVEGEDASEAAPTPPVDDLESKAPVEGTFDDEEDDVFAGNAKKGKGGKKQQGKAAADEDDKDDEEGDGGGVKSKKEKEKEKREREKQRKKEQVG
jgi:translation initiation factor 5B